LLTAVLTLLTRKWSKIQTRISLGGSISYVVSVILLATKVFPDNILTYQLSSWPAPYGISFVADSLSVFMLCTTATIFVPALLFSMKYVDEYGHKISFEPLLHFMILGVTGAFLTGDLFNLFVWFEVMLISSYILVGFYGGKQETTATLYYVVTNLIGSAFMLVAIGGLYATVGTLNMADIGARLASPDIYNVSVEPVLGLSALLFCVFAIKAGIAPFQFWVPEAYKAAPAPVSAILAGAAKKVGLYAIIRLYIGIFSAAEIPISFFGVTGNNVLDFFGPVMLVMAVSSIIIGGFGAISRETLDEMLSYSSIGQAGFILLPIGLFSINNSLGTAAIAASLVYMLNHAVAKSMLFLSSGAIKYSTGTDRFDELGGLMDGSRLLAACFLIGALSLIGIPPLLGFFGKLLVFQNAINILPVLLVGILGSILAIIYFSRAWNQIFWGKTVEIVRTEEFKIQIAVLTALALVLVIAGLGSNIVIEAAQNGANAALSQEAYINAVLDTGANTTEVVKHGGGH
jgi:multicomponent Na+:H+ antiporter subunit D